MTKLAFFASISSNSWDWLVANWNTLNALDPLSWAVLWILMVAIMAALREFLK